MQKRSEFHTADVLSLAITTRIAVIAIAVLANVLIPDYDTSADISLHCNGNARVADKLACQVMGTFVRFDAVYFIEISENLYRYEQQMAFFPGLPMLMRTLAETGINSSETDEHVHMNNSIVSVAICPDRVSTCDCTCWHCIEQCCFYYQRLCVLSVCDIHHTIVE